MNSPSLFFQAHHVLITAVLVIVLFFGGVYGIDTLLVNHEARNDAKWQTVLAAQTLQSQQIQTKLLQDESQWAQQNAASAAAISSLALSIAHRDSNLKVQQTKNATLSSNEAATRLATLTNAPVSDVTALNDTVILSLPVTRKVVSSLDELVVARVDLVDVRNQLGEQQRVDDRLTLDIGAQKSFVASLQTQIIDEQKACKADIALVNAKARKSKLKWFGAGFIVGFVTRGFAGF